MKEYYICEYDSLSEVCVGTCYMKVTLIPPKYLQSGWFSGRAPSGIKNVVLVESSSLNENEKSVLTLKDPLFQKITEKDISCTALHDVKYGKWDIL